MLSGRIAELQYLDQYYEKAGSQILVVYGQKHIGKSTLLKEFAENRPSHYYLARPCSEREQLYQWGMQVRAAGKTIKEFNCYKITSYHFICSIYIDIFGDRSSASVCSEILWKLSTSGQIPSALPLSKCT